MRPPARPLAWQLPCTKYFIVNHPSDLPLSHYQTIDVDYLDDNSMMLAARTLMVAAQPTYDSYSAEVVGIGMLALHTGLAALDSLV